jgi:hypothetical protein
VRGRKPKPEETRRNATRPVHGWLEVENRPHQGPKLTGRWPAATRRWWQALRSMPHACLWEPSDWEFAKSTALLHAAMWRGDYRLAGEIRLREAIMGVTMPSRRDLRIRYVSPPPEDERLGVSALNDYRQRLVGIPALERT